MKRELRAVPAFWNGEEKILRLTFAQVAAQAAAAVAGRTEPPPAPVVLPDWLGRAVRVEANATLPVTPSSVLEIRPAIVAAQA